MVPVTDALGNTWDVVVHPPPPHRVDSGYASDLAVAVQRLLNASSDVEPKVGEDVADFLARALAEADACGLTLRVWFNDVPFLLLPGARETQVLLLRSYYLQVLLGSTAVVRWVRCEDGVFATEEACPIWGRFALGRFGIDWSTLQIGIRRGALTFDPAGIIDLTALLRRALDEILDLSSKASKQAERPHGHRSPA
jgi:hypothetical protein